MFKKISLASIISLFVFFSCVGHTKNVTCSVQIHVQSIKTEYELHRALAQSLQFPDYYGDNLDALYDVLVNMEATQKTEQPINVCLFGTRFLINRFGQKRWAAWKHTLRDAYGENPRAPRFLFW